MRNRLILFDVDGTLIDSGGAGMRALNKAFLELFGIRDAFRGISMAGKTDTLIIREELVLNGIPWYNGEVEMVIGRYIDLLKVEIENPQRKAKPGVYEILEGFAARGLPLGLLTGNIEAGARIKLNPFGLNSHFPSGAFGSDHDDRDMLLPVAISRYHELGIHVLPEDCVVIGDTPRDIQCAHVHGAGCIAVATGPYDRDSLAGAGADLVLDDLTGMDECLAFIDGM